MLHLDHLDHGGCPCGFVTAPNLGACVCLPTERVLRTYSADRAGTLSPLTPEDRNACLEAIAHVEGYERRDYEASSDADLARGVLAAWTDYCRDKGLL